MAMDYLQTDDLTILLALISATVFLLNNLYKPQPLVHPILLGRQSDVGRARNPTESAVYRNYGTGLLGRFPLRPGKDVHILADFIRPEIEAPRTLWSTKLTNSHLQDRAAAFATGLLRLGPIHAQTSSVLLLLNDSLEFLVADLALAAHSIRSLTLASLTLLAPVLDAHQPTAIITHAFLLPQLLELIYETGDRQTEYTVVLVGEPSAAARASVASNIKIHDFAELERQGFKVEKILSPLPKPSDIFTTAFYTSPSGQIHGAQLSHENLTAGVAAVRALLPLASALSPLDTVLSAHPLSTPYGRAVAYTAIYENTSFATVPTSELYRKDDAARPAQDASSISTRKYPIPAPTILFITPAHLASLASSILTTARSSAFPGLFAMAWRHKLAGVADGFITSQSLWDRLVFDGARTKVLGAAAASVRGVVVSGSGSGAGTDTIDSAILTPARIALSVPLVNVTVHPQVAAPILASHPLDLQDIPLPSLPTSSSSPSSNSKINTSSHTPAHTGPPGINVEVKLLGVDDAAVESGADPAGRVVVRGPPVGRRVLLEDYVHVHVRMSGSVVGEVGGQGQGGQGVREGDEGGEVWMETGLRARVLTNGAFVVGV